MFEDCTSAKFVGILFPDRWSEEGAYMNYLLEDLYPHLRHCGIDILMMDSSPSFSSDGYRSRYPWVSIHSDEQLYASIKDIIHEWDAPSLVFVNRAGEVLDTHGKDTILNMSVMYESNSVAKTIRYCLVGEESATE